MITKRRYVGLLVCFIFGASLIAGCSKKAGDSCAGSEVRCVGSDRALACVQGKFAEVACLGPGACVEASHRCDQSKAAAGDGCEGEWAACTADSKKFLECKANKLTQTATCGGSRGCYAMGKDLFCDQSSGTAGDMCSGKGGSCNTDGKSMLVCDGSKFVAGEMCRGPRGCETPAGKVKCDQSLGLPGDKCEGTTATCAVGGKTLLECKGDKLEPTTECRGPLGCRVQGTSVSCDRSFGLVGDACTGDSGACTVDGTQMLTCKKGKLATLRKCKCLAIGTTIRCD